MILFATALALAAAQPSPPPPVAPVADPARTAPAGRIASRLLPPGVFATMMKSTMDMVTTSMTDQMFDLPVRDFVRMAGIEDEATDKLGPATLREIMEIFDPAFLERQRIAMQVMGTEMGVLMTSMEPEYRAGLTESLARRFDAQQLGEIDRFFATPAGSAYASQSMLLYVDPAMMARVQSLMPKIMQAMPGIIQKVTAATAALPAPRDAKTMTPADKAKLKAIFEKPSR